MKGLQCLNTHLKACIQYFRAWGNRCWKELVDTLVMLLVVITLTLDEAPGSQTHFIMEGGSCESVRWGKGIWDDKILFVELLLSPALCHFLFYPPPSTHFLPSSPVIFLTSSFIPFPFAVSLLFVLCLLSFSFLPSSLLVLAFLCSCHICSAFPVKFIALV